MKEKGTGNVPFSRNLLVFQFAPDSGGFASWGKCWSSRWRQVFCLLTGCCFFGVHQTMSIHVVSAHGSKVVCRCLQCASDIGYASAAKANATTPVTCGHAMLVPSLLVVPPPFAVERIPTPGAANSTSGPTLLK